MVDVLLHEIPTLGSNRYGKARPVRTADLGRDGGSRLFALKLRARGCGI